MVSSAGGGADIAAHMSRYDPIKKSLLIIEGNVSEVHNLQAKNKNTTTEKQRKEVMSQLEKIMDSTNKNGGAIKKQLDEIKKENTSYAEKEGESSAKNQMRKNLYQTHIRRFHAVMNEYNTAAHGFKQDLQGQRSSTGERGSCSGAALCVCAVAHLCSLCFPCFASCPAHAAPFARDLRSDR